MADGPPLAFVLVPALLGVIWVIVSLIRHNRATSEAAERWRGRPTMGDAEFLIRCRVPDEPLKVSVALAARRVIADLGTVPPETIRPDDTFAQDLVQLPFWDSLDWLGFILDVEGQFEGEVRLPGCSVIDDALKQIGGRHADLRVEHVVRAVALGATFRPVTTRLDEER